jgi:hypothetical protein
MSFTFQEQIHLFFMPLMHECYLCKKYSIRVLVAFFYKRKSVT